MSDRLPPLTALRAFEAAARHLSFSKAAEELNVTPAALSFQIKSLEEHLGHPVFHRLTRAVELTELGERLRPGVEEGFTALARAWRAARRFDRGDTLTVTAGPAFTSTWLAARLFDFAQANPGIEMRLLASLKRVDLLRGDADVAIRFGIEEPVGHYMEPLVTDWFTPMMAPHIAAQVKTPEDVLKFPLALLEDTRSFEPAMDWAWWLKQAGLGEARHTGPVFSLANHGTEAAIAGACIILGRVSLTAPAVQAGRLVAPFRTAYYTRARYRFLCAPGMEERPAVRTFRDWLKAELALVSTLSEAQDLQSPDYSK